MRTTPPYADVVRKRAEWMRPVDERILETMRDEGNMTPTALDYLDVTTRSHASVRLSELSKYGLVERIVQGLYRLTDDGRAFLDEELDASTLEPVDESD
jgi:Mn-dependent DtxR family transcriptional regulator